MMSNSREQYRQDLMKVGVFDKLREDAYALASNIWHLYESTSEHDYTWNKFMEDETQALIWPEDKTGYLRMYRKAMQLYSSLDSQARENLATRTI